MSIWLFISIIKTSNTAANAEPIPESKQSDESIADNRNRSGLIGDWGFKDSIPICSFRDDGIKFSVEAVLNPQNPCRGHWNYVEGSLHFTYLNRRSTFTVEWISNYTIVLKPQSGSYFDNEITLYRLDGDDNTTARERLNNIDLTPGTEVQQGYYWQHERDAKYLQEILYGGDRNGFDFNNHEELNDSQNIIEQHQESIEQDRKEQEYQDNMRAIEERYSF